jgi:CheY-like chemotaxis protein/HPt (histidine-containing phosphotransfer) domain-containing protein
MGGKISVQSEIGKGTKFFFTLRFQTYNGVTEKSESIPSEFVDLNVLIIDDNPNNRIVLEELLRDWGVKTKSADSGFAGLVVLEDTYYNQQKLDIIIVDNYMPGMDGLSVSKTIRGNPNLKDVKILMMLSNEKSSDISVFKEIGIDSFIIKPIIKSDLRSTILNLIGKPDSEKEELKIENQKEAFRSKSLRILLVEDNTVNQKLVYNILERVGHKIILVNNGKEALVALKYKKFDLILMDIQMPIMDGINATSKIRKQELETSEHIPIIAMTANAMKGDREKYLEAGMDDYISKPIDPAELFSAIKKVIRGMHSVYNDPENIPVDLHMALKKLDGDKKLLTELVGIIKNEYKIIIEDLRRSIIEKEFQKMREAAHYIKTSLGSISAKLSYNLAYEIEMKAKNEDLNSVSNMLDQLENSIEDIINFFNTPNWEEYL